MKKVAVFLRAINLAGRRLLMADFKRALEACGHPDAQTVVATGNAVILARSADPALEARIAASLETTLGQSTEVFVRDGAQMAAIVAANPFPAMARDNPSHLVVVFLNGEPLAADVAALQAKIKGAELVAAGPAVLYACYVDGIGESKLSAVMIESALKLRGTARNWNTVARMVDLTRDT